MNTDSSTEVRQAAELMALHARIEALEAALREATIVTDEMVMAGAKAMVRLGHDHRTRGEPMPTRLQEARACLPDRPRRAQ